jgi:hypothetical protein
MKIQKLHTVSSAAILIAVLLIALGVASRLVPHPANFASIAAIAMFAGAILPRRLAIIVPLAAMVLSDAVIGFHSVILFTWGSFLLIALLSSSYFKKVSVAGVVGASLGASILFFVVTNFGVWLEGRMYDMSLTGLIQCYYNALPFFRNTMLGDLAFSGLLFGAYGLVQSAVRVSRSRLHSPR